MPRFNHKSAGKSGHQRAERRPARPLSPAQLDTLALAYVARFATSAAKLEAYLARKLRERGWQTAADEPMDEPMGQPMDDGPMDEGAMAEGRANIAAVIARFVAAGYVDDAGYARMRAGSLGRRGLGQRRIAEDLNAAGIAEDIREEVRPSEWAARNAALICAKKRGLGVFARRAVDPADKALRQKQTAALLRAGHSMDYARALLNAPDVPTAEAWVAEAREEDEAG